MKAYEKMTGVSIKPVKASRYGDYNFLTNLNSTLVGDVLLTSLNIICNIILSTKKLDAKLKVFIKNFITEEIVGDGSLCVSNSGVTLQISDEDKFRRKVIKTILDKLGIKARDDNKLLVHSDITDINKRFHLLNLDILKGKNRRKLINSIHNLKFLNLQMRRLKLLQNLKEFDNKTVCKIFGWSGSRTTKWLLTMLKRGFITRIRKEGYSVFYTVNKTNRTVQQYMKWEEEYKKFFVFNPSSRIDHGVEQR
jgi:predicted transcriptional regulator